MTETIRWMPFATKHSGPVYIRIIVCKYVRLLFGFHSQVQTRVLDKMCLCECFLKDTNVDSKRAELAVDLFSFSQAQ